MRSFWLFAVSLTGLVLLGCGSKGSGTPEPTAKTAAHQPPSGQQTSPAQPAVNAPANNAPPAHPANLSHNLAAATVVTVEIASVVDSSISRQALVRGTVTDDVKGPDGRVAVPAGSPATIIIRQIGKKGSISMIDLGLYAISVAGEEHPLGNGQSDPASVSFREDAGKGPGHTTVHLQYGTRLRFKLRRPVHLR